MKRWIVLLFLLSWLFVACSGTNTTQTGSATDGQQNMLVHNDSTPTNSPTITPTRASAPTIPPAVHPTPKPTAKPTPKPTPKPTTGPTYHSCTIASCPNPWGYHLQNGAGSPLVTSVPSGFCSYFHCMASFANGGGGDVVECSNREFSWNGAYYSPGCPGMTIMGWLAP